MRSISHVVASELGKRLGGTEWGSRFYASVIQRPDDMMEILSFHKANNGKIPAAMKKGFAMAFDQFDTYQLAKYRAEDKAVKLIDVVNLVHPIPVEKNMEALKLLVAGKLKSEGTWEAGLTKAGQNATDNDSKIEAKAEVWKSLIREKKLGYIALLRNLRNIMTQAPDMLKEALDSLTNAAFIKKARVFPFQFLTAYKQFIEINTKEARLITAALSTAIELSCANVNDLNFEGDTLVVWDSSGSMDDAVAGSDHMRRVEAASLFGFVLGKTINADLMEFADYAGYVPYQLNDNPLRFAAAQVGVHRFQHGTNFHSIFQTANKKYDRIIIFSDMQGWIGGYSPKDAFNNYKRLYSANPLVYSFDLAGYGSLQLPERNVFCLAGFSEKVFDTMKLLETDKNALLTQVKSVVI